MLISKSQLLKTLMKITEWESVLFITISMMTPFILLNQEWRIVEFPKVYFWNATKSLDPKMQLSTTHGKIWT